MTQSPDFLTPWQLTPWWLFWKPKFRRLHVYWSGWGVDDTRWDYSVDSK